MSFHHSFGSPSSPEFPVRQVGLLAGWWAGGAVCLWLFSKDVYHHPDAQKFCVIAGLIFWLIYLAHIARATVHENLLMRMSGSTNLVAAFGIGLPALLWQIGRNFPTKRGYPAVETLIVAAMTTFTGLLPMQSMLLLSALFFGVSTCDWYARSYSESGDAEPLLKDLILNLVFCLPSCCILCLARNRIFPLPSNKAQAAAPWPGTSSSHSSYSAAASALAAPAVMSINGMAAMLAAAACLPAATDSAAAQQQAPLDRVGLALRTAAAACVVAACTAIVSAATTAWLPPGAGALERLLKSSPRFAALWAKLGLAEAHPVPPSQCFVSALLFPGWAQRGGKWLLDAVPQGPAETLLATLAALAMGIHFAIFVMSYITNSIFLWSPTYDILSMFAGITLGSSQGQHLHNLSCAQQRMYRSAASLLRGLIPEHIVDAMMLRSLSEDPQEQEQARATPASATSFTSVSSNAEHAFGLAELGGASEAAAEGQDTGLSRLSEQRTSFQAPRYMPRKSVSSRSLSFNSARRMFRVSTPGREQSTEDSFSCQSHPSLDDEPPPALPSLLEDKQGAFLERHEDVTIMFCDLVGFTALSEQITPKEVMCLLGDLYRKYDELAAKLKLYTLDTIGDCYMCAANLIYPLESHVDAAVGFAQSVIEITSRTQSPLGEPLSVRVGLHTGPVIAGILGYHRFKFTTVGDTVNIASRLQTSAPPNGIQMSEHSFWQLQRPEIPASVAEAAASATDNNSGFNEDAFKDLLAACLSPQSVHPPRLSSHADESTREAVRQNSAGEAAAGVRDWLGSARSSSQAEDVGLRRVHFNRDAAGAVAPRSKSAARPSQPLVLSPSQCVRRRSVMAIAPEEGRGLEGGAGFASSRPPMRNSSDSGSGRQGGPLSRMSLSRFCHTGVASPTQSAQQRQLADLLGHSSTHKQPIQATKPPRQSQPPHHADSHPTCQARSRIAPAASHRGTSQSPPHSAFHHAYQGGARTESAASHSGVSQHEHSGVSQHEHSRVSQHAHSRVGQHSGVSQSAGVGACSHDHLTNCSDMDSSSRSNDTRTSVAEEVSMDSKHPIPGPSSPGAETGYSIQGHLWAPSVIDVKGKGKMSVFCYAGKGRAACHDAPPPP